MPAATEHSHRIEEQPTLGFRRRAAKEGLRMLVVAAGAIVLACQLLVPPIVGMADNGDFPKMIGRYGLTSPDYWDYIATRYPWQADYYYDPGFRSSEQVFVRSALTIGRLIGKDGSLDLRVAGIVHGALLLFAFALFVPLLEGKARSVQLIFCGAALFVLTDVMYVGYLNSFYMDVSALLMLLLAAVSYLRAIAWRRRADAILFAASSLLLITSKPQHAALGVWIAALMWIARGPLWGGRKPWAIAAATLVLVTSWATFRFAAPRGYSANNCFNVVFFQILPNTGNVNRTLADLGLRGSDRVWIGKTAYSPGSQMGDLAFSRAFSRKVSYPKLAQFYLTHPSDAWRALRSSLSQAGRERERIGNFPASAGKPPLSESRSFAAWSDLKHRLFYPHGLRLLLSFLGFSGLVIVLLLRRRPAPKPGVLAGAVILIGTAAMEMGIASLADALDVVRHHLIFHLEFDMLILATLWLALHRVTVARR